ncbi:MAG: hypothetical protein MSA04_09260, partial [Clostridiales bacterium]|nr:hypothetical protein [Clostridiales bacterium]
MWLSIFRRYLELLETGALEQKDEQSGRIYPNRMKQQGREVRQVTLRRVCRDCGESFDLTAQEEAYYSSLRLLSLDAPGFAPDAS